MADPGIALKSMNSVSNMMEVVLKMMILMQMSRTSRRPGHVGGDEFCIQNDEICITNDEICIKKCRVLEQRPLCVPAGHTGAERHGNVSSVPTRPPLCREDCRGKVINITEYLHFCLFGVLSDRWPTPVSH